MLCWIAFRIEVIEMIEMLVAKKWFKCWSMSEWFVAMFQMESLMKTSLFKPLSFSLISSYKTLMGPKSTVSNAFFGFENWSGSGISEQFKCSEMPVSPMVSQCFWHWWQKMMSLCSAHWVLCWVLFSSIVAMFSLRDWIGIVSSWKMSHCW